MKFSVLTLAIFALAATLAATSPGAYAAASTSDHYLGAPVAAEEGAVQAVSPIVGTQPGYVPTANDSQARPVIRRYWDPSHGWHYYVEYTS